MEETKIKGLKIIFQDNFFTIYDSYKITNIKKMKIILDECLEKTILFQTKRTKNSLLKEWISHNILYKLHLFRKHTKNCDFEKNINLLFTLLYFLLSFIPIVKDGLKIFILNKKIKLKRKKYKKSIKKHLKAIKKAYMEFKRNPNTYLIVDKELLDKLYIRIINHDASKFSKEEFEYYRKNFYPINNKEKEDNLKDFEKALEHHYKNNSHHWQNRQYKISFNITNDEEVLDVLENILDWIAVGYKFKNTAKEYYEQNKEDIILCNKERDYLEHIIYDILNEKENKKWKKKKHYQ